MTDKFDDIVDNLKQPSHWVRLPFMLAFGFVLYLIFVPVVLVVMAAQILFALLTGESNRNLRGLGSVVQQYVSQIVDYITYNSDTRPYPFSDFPMNGFESDESSAAGEEAVTSISTAEESSKSKPAAKVAKKAKKTTSKKKATDEGKDPSSAPKKATKKKAPAKKKAAKVPSASDSSESTSTESASDEQSTGT